MALTWNDADEIGYQLAHARSEDPLAIRFTDLHQWITELEEFGDDPARSHEGVLEAIQMAWYDEWRIMKGE